MCNFIIRQDVKSYATVDIVQEDGDGDTIVVERGDWIDVQHIKDNSVNGLKRGVIEVVIPLETFVHAFSDKDPNKKESK